MRPRQFAAALTILSLSALPASAIVTYDSDANSSFELLDAGGMTIMYTIGVEPTSTATTGTGTASLDADMHAPTAPPAMFAPTVGVPVTIDSEVSGSATAPAGTSMAEVPNGIFVELDNLGSPTPSTAVFAFSYSWFAEVTRDDPALEAGFASPFFHLTGFAPSGTETLMIDELMGGGPVSVGEWLVHPAVSLGPGGATDILDTDTATVLALVTLPPDSFNAFSVITDSAGGAATPPTSPEPASFASALVALIGLVASGGRRRRR